MAENPLQRLQSREDRVPEIAYAGTQSRTHEEKTLRRFHFMRNQVGGVKTQQRLVPVQRKVGKNTYKTLPAALKRD